METIIIYKNKCYVSHANLDVFFLKDNFKTETLVNALVKSMKQISVADIAGRKMFKFENFRWYFWEHDFMCWEDTETYRPCPELAPEVQAQYMMELSV